MPLKTQVLSLSALAIYAVLIAWLSLMPSESAPPRFFQHEDKVLHFLAYAVFVLPVMTFVKLPRLALMMVAFIWCFSGLMEIAQGWIPGRDSSWLDMLANTLGVTAGFYFVRALFPKAFVLVSKSQN